jgi:hypothetical protein
MQILKQELIKELRTYPINPEKDPKDCAFTRDFLVTVIYKLIYKYQVIGKEIVKE